MSQPDEPVIDEVDSFGALVDTARRSIVDGRRRSRPESAITKEAIDWISAQPRSVARKVHQEAVTGAGEPDVDACVRGRTVKIEMKRPGERPTGRQMRRLQRWQRAGAVVGWATGLPEVVQIVEHVDDWASENPLTGPGWPDPAPP